MANFYLKHDTKIDIGRKDITINVMKIVCSLFSLFLFLFTTFMLHCYCRLDSSFLASSAALLDFAFSVRSQPFLAS